jgi:hypothetical protein
MPPENLSFKLVFEFELLISVRLVMDFANINNISDVWVQ